MGKQLFVLMSQINKATSAVDDFDGSPSHSWTDSSVLLLNLNIYYISEGRTGSAASRSPKHILPMSQFQHSEQKGASLLPHIPVKMLGH